MAESVADLTEEGTREVAVVDMVEEDGVNKLSRSFSVNPAATGVCLDLPEPRKKSSTYLIMFENAASPS